MNRRFADRLRPEGGVGQTAAMAGTLTESDLQNLFDLSPMQRQIAIRLFEGCRDERSILNPTASDHCRLHSDEKLVPFKMFAGASGNRATTGAANLRGPQLN